MSLLFDANLSRTLCQRLADTYPGSTHVCLVGLERASDREIWDYAGSENLVIVSKDGDFHDLSFLFGAPPKVVWLKIGNCTTNLAEQILRNSRHTIEDLIKDDEAAILILQPSEKAVLGKP